MDDPFDLQRFVDAQAPVMADVEAELRAGRKRRHWMWFVFPQLDGLGSSPMARRYAISGLDEARAYLAHPVLGPRLKCCAALVKDAPGDDIRAVMGSPDDLKLCSSMTLFHAADPGEPVFAAVVARWYGGRADPRTLAGLGATDAQTGTSNS